MRLLVLGLLVLASNGAVSVERLVPPDQQDRQARYLELNPPVELPGPNPTPDTDELYAQAATVISKRPTLAQCHSPEEWETLGHPTALAFARPSRTPGEIHLAPITCERLRVRNYEGVLTLAHEAWHLTGIRDEPTVQCYGQQTIAVVVVALGAKEASARALQASGPPTDPRSPYYSPECRDGGGLDLNPTDSRWP